MSEKGPYRVTFTDRLLILLGWAFLTLMMRLNRLDIRGEEHLTAARASNRPVYVGAWHSRLLFCAWVMRRYRPISLVSQSRDGEIVSRITELWGWTNIRGSSRRGGRGALHELIRAVNRPDALLAIAMDGPKGPAQVAKPGSLTVAAKKGAVFIPFAATATRRWVFEKSWDRFQVPKPFGRIIVLYGPPIGYAPDIDDESLARLVSKHNIELERQVDALAAQLA